VTRITGKIEYDTKSNKVIGFVLLFENGCPLYNSFPETSAKTIAEYFQTGIRANYAYVIMAQSLDDKAPPFCVAIYGTDNRFTNEDVMSRWNFIKLAAASQGIEIIGFLSDGDTRLLKAMQLQSGSMCTKENNLNVEAANDWSWFSIDHPPMYSKMKLTEKYTFKILYILEPNYELDFSNLILFFQWGPTLLL